MTGFRWLHALCARESSAAVRRSAMIARLRRKSLALTADECRRLLESFVGTGGVERLHQLSVEWIGCWSQSMDDEMKRALGRRAYPARFGER